MKKNKRKRRNIEDENHDGIDRKHLYEEIQED